MISDCTLESISTFINRGITPKYTESKENSILVINQKCIRDFQVSSEQARLNDLSKQKVASDKLLQKFDVLVNSTGVGTLGRVAQYFGDKSTATVDSHVTIVRPDIIKVDPLFFGYLIKNKQTEIEGFAQGTTGQTELSRESLKSLKLRLLDDLKKQESVGNCLKALDDKIELNNQINQTLEAMAQAIFKSWFVDFEPVKAKMTVLQAGGSQAEAELAAMMAISGKTAEQLSTMLTTQAEAYQQLTQTAALFPAAMQESELREIPEGWDLKCIANVANTIKGQSYKSDELKASKTALVTLKSFSRGGGYRLDGLKEYIGKYKAEQEVFAGDLIIAYTDVTQAADVIGKPAMVISDSRYKHLVISLDVAVVRPEKDYLKYYLYALAKTEHFQQHTTAYATGTTVLHLSKNAVPDYKFCMPADELVKNYKNQVKPIFDLINTNIEQSSQLGELRDLLLPKLLSGEIDLSARDEVAT